MKKIPLEVFRKEFNAALNKARNKCVVAYFTNGNFVVASRIESALRVGLYAKVSLGLSANRLVKLMKASGFLPDTQIGLKLKGISYSVCLANVAIGEQCPPSALLQVLSELGSLKTAIIKVAAPVYTENISIRLRC